MFTKFDTPCIAFPFSTSISPGELKTLVPGFTLSLPHKKFYNLKRKGPTDV